MHNIPETILKAQDEATMLRGSLENKSLPTDIFSGIVRSEAPLTDAGKKTLGREKTKEQFKNGIRRSSEVEQVDNDGKTVRTKKFEFYPETGDLWRLVIEDGDGNTVKRVFMTLHDGNPRYTVSENFFDGESDYPTNEYTLDTDGKSVLDRTRNITTRIGRKIYNLSRIHETNQGSGNFVTDYRDENERDNQGRIVKHHYQSGTSTSEDYSLDEYNAVFEGNSETRTYNRDKRFTPSNPLNRGYRDLITGTQEYQDRLLRVDSYRKTYTRGNDKPVVSDELIRYDYDHIRRIVSEATTINDQISLERKFSYRGASKSKHRKEEIDHSRQEIRSYYWDRKELEWTLEETKALDAKL